MIQKPWLQTFAYLVWQNKNISLKTFKSLKEKRAGRPSRRPPCRLIHNSKKHTFLILQADSYFLLKEKLSFPQEGCHFLQGDGGRPFKG